MALGASLVLSGCQSMGLADDPTEQEAREQQGPSFAELLEDPNMVPVSEAEVRRYFTGNTAYWEPVEQPERLYAVYYDSSGEMRMRERRDVDTQEGRWRLDEAIFCQTEPDSAAEGCGAFVAGPDDLLVYCTEARGCSWLVVGLNEGNSLSL
ncbi:MAG TPA: hypothetical protein VKY54_13705 [Kiloniellales bacterium]|jgi:hypothetical protein|nr:hypothetical protein [Kiloniellales bacterium]